MAKTTETALEIAESIYRAALTDLRKRQRKLLRDKEAAPEVLGKLLAATRAASEPLRQLEKLNAKAAAQITREMVLLWARQQAVETRRRLVQELQAIDNPSKLSVLA